MPEFSQRFPALAIELQREFERLPAGSDESHVKKYLLVREMLQMLM